MSVSRSDVAPGMSNMNPAAIMFPINAPPSRRKSIARISNGLGMK